MCSLQKVAGTWPADSVDILRPWSVMARAEIQIEFGLVGDAMVSKVSAKSTSAWLTNERAQVSKHEANTTAQKSDIGTLRLCGSRSGWEGV
jgi:hypothetical protein